MRRLLLALLALALGSSAAVAAPRPHALEVLQREGRWLVDSQHRVVLLHGVNAVWKTAPYAPPATAAGFTARDADWLAAQGFDTVRLGVIFAGVMPSRGQVDPAYLDKVARVVDLLAARHIWVLLDFHQDMYNERFAGEGFPAWAVDDEGIPTPANLGFPGNYFQPSTTRAFDNFYANKDGLADLYAQAWRAVAQRFLHTSYVLGYDVMNEPWPGSSFATCANPLGCPVFDAQSLQPLYAKVLRAVRSVDTRRLLWVEPQVLFNDGSQTTLTSLGDANVGLSFHHYCTTASFTHSSGGTAGPDCPAQGELVFGHADTVTAHNGWTSLLTEFGASDDLTDIATLTRLADEHLVGWQYWHYKEWADPTTESQGSGGQGMFTKDSDLTTLKQAKADLLIRPFARAVAGVPTSMSFEPKTRTFLMSYRSARGLTEVFLPARQYRHGYVVVVHGATVASKAGAQLLLLRTSGSGTVRLGVRPR
jgi:endoglycosylceramidase